MSDSEKDGDRKVMPEGMVRKTRRVRKRRRSGSSREKPKEDANTLFARAKEILMGMQEEDQDFGHIEVAEQVRRLKKQAQAEKPLDDVWGTKKRSTSWLWIVLVAAIASVVAIVIGVTMWVQKDPSTVPEKRVLEDDRFKVEEMDLSDGPLAWYNQNSLEVINEVKSVIDTVGETNEADSIEKLLRDSPFRALNPIDLNAIGSRMLTTSYSKLRWTPKVVVSSESSGSKERGYLKVNGVRENRSPFEAYFVLQDGRVVLDWDATLGWSEMPFVELIEEKPFKPMLLRCRVTSRPFYEQKFGDTNYSGYILSGEEEENFFVAYVNLDKPKGKEINRALRMLVNLSFISLQPPKENVKATLRVGFREGIGESGQFEIMEYLHDGWVTP